MTESRDDARTEDTAEKAAGPPPETDSGPEDPQGAAGASSPGETAEAVPAEQTGEAPEGSESGRVVEGSEVSASEEGAGTEMNREDLDSLLEQMEVGAGPEKSSSGSSSSGGGSEFKLPEVEPDSSGGEVTPEKQIELLKDVNVKVRVELGRGSMYLRDILRLAEGSVVELEKLAGDPLDIYVNDRLIAKGEVLVLNENFCIRVTEIYSPQEVLKQTG